MENGKCSCTSCCSEQNGYTVVACSGASDLGQLTDLVSRKLSQNGVRQMKCLAQVGARYDKIINLLKNANVLVIDGCADDCSRLIMEKAGIDRFIHLRLTDLGYPKGQTPATEATVNQIYVKAEVLY